MTRLFSLTRNKIGMSPGSVVFTGEQQVDEVRVTAIRFDQDRIEETDVPESSGIRRPGGEASGVTWINVYGLHDTELIKTIGAEFGLHSLVLEDLVNVGGRPQLGDYSEYLSGSFRMLSWGKDERIQDELISLLMGPGWVLSFQERPGDVFGRLRDRLRKEGSRVRSRGADYLWYAMIDSIVDHYILVVGELAERAENLEEQVWDSEGDTGIPAAVQAARREALVVRRALRPTREMVEQLISETPELITDDTRIFLRDLKDHVLELSDNLETIRETLSSVMDAHLSLLSQRANDVMKVLTIMASIFIPLTFIAGVYGMNFQHMPELSTWWAYPAVWAVMVAIASGMVFFFRRKNWL